MRKGSLPGWMPLMEDKELNTAKKIWKTFFLKTAEIASSVDWKITYAYYKPIPPNPKELEIFKKELHKLQKECVELFEKMGKKHDSQLEKLLKKLQHMEEEFIHYPFSDRLRFFLKRLEFIRKVLYRKPPQSPLKGRKKV
jgi:hypothetical protein